MPAPQGKGKGLNEKGKEKTPMKVLLRFHDGETVVVESARGWTPLRGGNLQALHVEGTIVEDRDGMVGGEVGSTVDWYVPLSALLYWSVVTEEVDSPPESLVE